MTLLAASVLGAGCASNHHVSPWGERPSSMLEAYMSPSDLPAQLAVVDAETASLGLVKTEESTFELPPKGSGRTAVLRGYAGRDVAHRPVHAVRVATPHGVVLALGPLEAGDLDRGLATELVPALVGGEPGKEATSALAFRSGTDLNGDGTPDVVVKNEAGALAIWRVGELGSGAYTITMATAPTRAVDVEGDAHIALWGQVAVDPADPIAPVLADVATFDGSAYANATRPARAWHQREAALRPARKTDGDAARLRAAIERAWHTILAGTPREGVLGELAREPVPKPLAASFEMHRRRLSSLASH
jgi:hypothetical protein